MDAEIRAADLILVFGARPALDGATAAQLAEVADREYGALGPSLGLVIVAAAATALDKFATVKVNSCPDSALAALRAELGVDTMAPVTVPPAVVEACDQAADAGCAGAEAEAGDDGKSDGPDVACLDSSHRAFVTDALTHFKEIEEDDPRIHHGRMLSETCLEPPDEEGGQYRDKEHTLDFKIEKMINLVKLSKKTVFYMDGLDCDPVSCTVQDRDLGSKNIFK